MQECPKKGMIVHNIEEIEVRSYSDIFRCMRKGVKNRKIGVTQENHRSSRSHTLFILSLEQIDPNPSSTPIFSKLNIVDLAGSERLSSNEQQKIKETKNINKSLLSLTKCITHLSDPLCDRKYVPFRESKLTRLLKESLGGNSKTTVICTARVLESHIDETLRTLRFARETKKISSQLLGNNNWNQNLANEAAHNDDLLSQIQYLKAANAQLRQDNLQLQKEIRKRANVGHSPANITTPWRLDNSILTPQHLNENTTQLQSFSEPKQQQSTFLQLHQKQQLPLKSSDLNQPRRRKTMLESNSSLSESFIARQQQLVASSQSQSISREETMKWKTKYLNLKKETDEQIKSLQKQIILSKKNSSHAASGLSSSSPRPSMLLYNQLSDAVRVLTQKFLDQESIIKNERASIKLSRADISRPAGSSSANRQQLKLPSKTIKQSNSIGSPQSQSACEVCDKKQDKIDAYELSLIEFEKNQAKLLDQNLKGKKVLNDLSKRLSSFLPEQQQQPSKRLEEIAELANHVSTPIGNLLHDSISLTFNANSESDSFSFSFDGGEDAEFFEKLQEEISKFEKQKEKISNDITHHKKRMNEYSSLNQSMFQVPSTPPPNSGRTPLEKSSKSVKSMAQNLQDFTSRLTALGPIAPAPTTPKSVPQFKHTEATPSSLINKSYFSISGPGYLDLNISRIENSLYDEFELESIHTDSSFRQNTHFQRHAAPAHFIDNLNGPSPIAQAKRFTFPEETPQQHQDDQKSASLTNKQPLNN